jgi:hypothetical protein
MQILTELEAEQLRGGLGTNITVAPSVTITTGLIGVLQMNNGANAATSIGGSAGIGVFQGNGLKLDSVLG